MSAICFAGWDVINAGKISLISLYVFQVNIECKSRVLLYLVMHSGCLLPAYLICLFDLYKDSIGRMLSAQVWVRLCVGDLVG